MRKLLFLFAMMTMVTTSFAQKKIFVLWYSETGTTSALAFQIGAQLGTYYAIDGKVPNVVMDVIQLEEPYTGNMQETMQRSQREKQSGNLPKMKIHRQDLLDSMDFDVLFLGYPIWGGTYATPILSLLKKYDFAGKTIVPFCTFGSGGLNTSAADLKKALPKANVVTGFGARAARVKTDTKGKLNPVWKELNRFLIENGYMPGTVEPLPAYSAQKPVGDKERKLFDEACSSYQFPLGTPQTFGVRETAESTDYEFKVKSQGFGGGGESTIYVTIAKEPGAKAEFTEVVR